MPDASVTVQPAPLFVPHVRRIAAYGKTRGIVARRRGIMSAGIPTIGLFVLVALALVGTLLTPIGIVSHDVWLVTWLIYFAAVGLASLFGGLRFHSSRVGWVLLCALPLTHVVYIVTFIAGFVRGRS
jgi:hypothetical protein